MTSCDIVRALHNKHQAPEWASFEEMPVGTGHFLKNYIDFWTISCFPSTGFRVVAYEIKVSRGDFMREIQNPRKRKAAEEISSESWFVVPQGLIKPEEVPEPWGLAYVQSGGKVVRKLVAKQREFAPDLTFLAAAARRSADASAALRRALLVFDGEEVTPSKLQQVIERRAIEVAKADHYRILEQARREVREEVMGSDELKAFQNLLEDGRFLGWGSTKLERVEKIREHLAKARDYDHLVQESKRMHQLFGKFLASMEADQG